jgi:hypothetical protein
MELASFVNPQMSISLAEYMTPMFDLARRRSLLNDPSEENEAVILALAMYFGTNRFEHLTGTVRTELMKEHIPNNRRVTLRDRSDLRLHFIYSAALKLASDSGISFALGEFKELVDVAPDGSGFSFADLAADRAGIWFAEEATRDEASARRMQSLLSNSGREGVFFPAISDLPENLSEQAFETEFGGIDGPGYRMVVREIDWRLERLELYRQQT